MNPYLVLLDIAGSVTLLLWAVRMVRTGVERSQEPALRRILREGSGGRLRALFIGTGIATVLQSATAVAILAAGFAASGIMSLGTGLAVMLGADIGSALVVQILTLDLGWLIPLLLVTGGILFFKGRSRQMRQGGRIALGVALILVSLNMISVATLPLREASLLPGIVAYLSGDFISAFLIGAAFAWLVQSSVAAILMIAAFAISGVMPVELGVSLVLGANLGGGLVAFGLTRNMAVEARRIVLGNLIFRASGAVLALLGFQLVHPPLDFIGADAARQLVNLHLGFNILLALISLPLTGLMARLTTRLVATTPDPAVPLPELASCLDQAVVDQPTLALASAKRELLRMAEIIERMYQPVMEIYETGDADKIRQVKLLERAANQAQKEITLYLTRIQYPKNDVDDERRGEELANFAINLEYVGDAITKTLLKLAETRRDQNLKFSAAGWRELNELHHRVGQNMQLALNVLMSEDRESARLLVAEKDAMRSAERESSTGHLNRLREGSAASLETSSIHLETVRTLKTINSLFASVAYPILSDTGDLLTSRLVRDRMA